MGKLEFQSETETCTPLEFAYPFQSVLRTFMHPQILEIKIYS